MTTSRTAPGTAPGPAAATTAGTTAGTGRGPDPARTVVAAALARARSAAEPGPDRDPGPLVPARPGPGLPVPAAGPGELPLEPLLRLSLAADGATGRGRLRPHASAGGRHPVSAHLLVGPGCPLPPGRYAYDPLAHRVHARGPAPGGVPAGAVAVLTVTPRRTAAHYGHRAWPLLLLDTGHAAAALVLAARAHGGTAGHPAVCPAVCRDATGPLLAAAAGLDRPVGETDEHPLAAVRLMPPDPWPGPWPLARWADGTGGTGGAPWPLTGTAGDGDGTDADDTGAVLRALTAAPRPGDGRESWWTPPPALPAPTGHDLLARRSAPPPLSGAPECAHLSAVLAAAAAAGPGLRWYAATGGPGGEPGPGLLAPDPAAPGGLRRVAAGEARPTLAAWAAGQGWAADAGAVLLACGCPSGAPPHRVRADHLTAGHAVGTAQAVATRLGLRSRPLGSWQGADLGAALGEPPGRDWVVHGLALAAPGTPGAPDGGDRP